ncbi:MAG: methyltransferase domain-containing protein, partial [Planctomycetota bacterium]
MMMLHEPSREFLRIDAESDSRDIFEHPDLAELTERHWIELPPVPAVASTKPVERLLAGSRIDGVVITLHRGLPFGPHLRLARRALAAGKRVWLWWPAENAVEEIDRERRRSYRRHWVIDRAVQRLRSAGRTGRLLATLPAAMLRGGVREMRGAYWQFKGRTPVRRAARADWSAEMVRRDLEKRCAGAREAPLLPVEELPDPSSPHSGQGVYLRTDFWAPITSGGSYGHTCYVAKHLARTSENLVCFLPHHYPLLEDLRVPQVVLPSPGECWDEESLLAASDETHRMLAAAVSVLRPAYIYERLCLGNSAGARLSRDLGIPYIVEYNGSEISMRRSFEGTGYRHERLLRLAEMVAFRQANLISVVSEPIREDLIARGVDGEKILVNPNGADPDAYAPLSAEEKRALRRELGWGDGHRVLGFTGTFGGWHGVDVLASALPRICSEAPHVRFLMIGDGNLRHLVDEAVATHGLKEQVRMTGRVPQDEGARLLKACDLYLSPHSSHMVDSRFFGSPTKLFEYMALAGGIVASDLEQIGEMLSPAVRRRDLENPGLVVTNERAALCPPGNAEEFACTVVALVRRSDICAALGRRARQALIDHYSWERHVQRLWLALSRRSRGLAINGGMPESRRPSPPRAVRSPAPQALDRYKMQAQRQWDEDPCGSHYVRGVSSGTLEWYREVERHRYQEYAPWMPETMEFSRHGGEDVLEIGGGLGTDLCQFALHGARVTDVDLSAGHLAHAQRNFEVRGLKGLFIHQDAETLPCDDESFDLVYSNGVIHHTPRSARVVDEIYRVLRPGGQAILMVYAENSLHYWRNIFWDLGVRGGLAEQWSMGEILSRHAELGTGGAKPLVKVYTRQRLRALFSRFERLEIV